jgi:hypothetical protein
VGEARNTTPVPIPIDSARNSASTDHVGPHKLLIETVRDYAIFVLDPEGRVLTWNPGAQARPKGRLDFLGVGCNHRFANRRWSTRRVREGNQRPN